MSIYFFSVEFHLFISITMSLEVDWFAEFFYSDKTTLMVLLHYFSITY